MNSTIKIIRPSGIFNGTQTAQFHQEISDSISTGVKDILINFKDITFMDSSGLGSLIVALRMLQNAGGNLSLCSISNEVKIVFELTDVEKFFNIFSDQTNFEKSQKYN
jgi:anti-sigma B factor antagonist